MLCQMIKKDNYRRMLSPFKKFLLFSCWIFLLGSEMLAMQSDKKIFSLVHNASQSIKMNSPLCASKRSTCLYYSYNTDVYVKDTTRKITWKHSRSSLEYHNNAKQEIWKRQKQKWRNEQNFKKGN